MRQVISFSLNVLIENRGDYWEAYIEPLGMTVYGDTESAAKDRVFQAMDFLNKYFDTKDDGAQRFRAYLDAHGIPSLVTTDAVQDDAATRVQYSVPMDIPPLDAHGVPSLVTTDAVQNGAATRIHHLIPMDIPMEVAASG